MIRIIDYGLGNVRAFLNVYKAIGIPAAVARSEGDLDGASHVILPGVGSFDHAMELLDRSGLVGRLTELAVERRVPVLGVCVGMQILAQDSEEGRSAGLGWVKGSVRKFRADVVNPPLSLPHMGWNDVSPSNPSALFAGLEEGARFYFLHSHRFCCANPGDILAEAEYGERFVCAVQSNNVYGVQFHPEKSHEFGTRLLKNFGEL
jgi:glutamine amidotransferase